MRYCRFMGNIGVTSPLFADFRESGMLEAMVTNAAHTTEDMVNHTPAFNHGNVLYFKPDQIPSGISEESSRYWIKMMEFEAGNYGHYCERDALHIVHTPHEHDLMMDDASLDIIVPELMRAIESQTSEGVRLRPVAGAGGQRDRDGQEADGLEADKRDRG